MTEIHLKLQHKSIDICQDNMDKKMFTYLIV